MISAVEYWELFSAWQEWLKTTQFLDGEAVTH